MQVDHRLKEEGFMAECSSAFVVVIIIVKVAVVVKEVIDVVKEVIDVVVN